MKEYIPLETIIIKPNLVVVASRSTTFANLELRGNPPMIIPEAKWVYTQYLDLFKEAYEFWSGIDLSKGLDEYIDLKGFYQLSNNIDETWHRAAELGRYDYMTDDLIQYKA